MALIRRLLAAATLTFLICAGLLIWSAYQNRDAGMSATNGARLVGAVVLVALAGYGSRIRHQPPPPSRSD